MCLYRINSLILLFFTVFSLAELAAQDSTAVKQDSIPQKTKKKFFERFQINAVRVGLDLVPPAIFIVDQNFRNLEVSGELVMNRKFYLAVDLGIDRTIREGGNYRYKSSGSYFRLGIDYNLWHKNKSGVGSIFLLGFHTGLTSMQHSLEYALEGTYWESTQGNLDISGVTVGWFEIKAGLRAKLAPNFYVGPIARFKVRFFEGENKGLEIHDVPGYGLNNSAKIRVGYQILYQIPLSKTK